MGKIELRKLIIIVSLVSVLAIAAPFASGCGLLPGKPAAEAPAPAPEEPAPAPEPVVETVKVGFIAALTGPSLEWGLPGFTGLNMWTDRVNSEGGIVAGDKRYMVEIVSYDDQYTGSLAVMGAKKLILEEGVSTILMCDGAPVIAVHPICAEHEMLYIGCCGGETHVDRPWFIGGAGVAWPAYEAGNVQYIANTYPDVKRVATTTQDEMCGRLGMAWHKAAAEVNGLEVVYDKFFAVDTTDFAPIATAIMATDPDAVLLGCTWPDFQVLLMEELYLQGYDGIYEIPVWDPDPVLAKVPAEHFEGTVDAQPVASDPLLPAASVEFYNDWMARYGPGGPEDKHRQIGWADMNYRIQARLWEFGVQKAGTIDSAAVREALLAQDILPYTHGEAEWYGEEIYGHNQALIPLEQFVTVFHDGKRSIPEEGGTYDLGAWYQENKEYVIKYLEEFNLMYYQQQ